MGTFTKVFFVITLISLIGTSAYYLWQRQPGAGEKETPAPATSSAIKSAEEQKPPEQGIRDGQVVFDSKVKFLGKTIPNSYLAIYSRDSSQVAKVDNDGNYDKEFSLIPDLNLIKTEVILPEATGGAAVKSAQKSLTVWWSKDKNLGDTILRGEVKSVFDTLVTIISEDGEKRLRTNKSTDFSVPKEEAVEATISALKSIRIGDYAIAVGAVAEKDAIVASKLSIFRGNIPQNTKKVAVYKITSTVQNKIFSAQDVQKNSVQFTAGANLRIARGDQEARAADIKDKYAIIFFIENGQQNLVDLVYLIP